jgi:hypothetical protein
MDEKLKSLMLKKEPALSVSEDKLRKIFELNSEALCLAIGKYLMEGRLSGEM